MISRLVKIASILLAAGVVAGCKLAVIVPSGGDVQSLSGTRNCSGGSLCEFTVTETTFNETFTAVARPGYVFNRWQAGPGFLCAGSTNPACVANNTGLSSGEPAIGAVIAGGSLFYAMPLFDFVGIDTDNDGVKNHVDADDDNDGVLDVDDACPLVGPNADGNGCPSLPITDTVTANGRLWAQPADFTNLSWNDIHAACPAGLCTAGALLNGFVMTGWRWATVDDVNALFNSYIGSTQLGPGPSQYIPPLSVCFPTQTGACPFAVITAFGEAGKFDSTDTNYDSYLYLTGLVSEVPSPADAYKATAGANIAGSVIWASNLTQARTLASPTVGAWFYRTP